MSVLSWLPFYIHVTDPVFSWLPFYIHVTDPVDPVTCSNVEFKCGDGSCIDIRRKCDGHKDCGDASDERKCGMYCR